MKHWALGSSSFADAQGRALPSCLAQRSTAQGLLPLCLPAGAEYVPLEQLLRESDVRAEGGQLGSCGVGAGMHAPQCGGGA